MTCGSGRSIRLKGGGTGWSGASAGTRVSRVATRLRVHYEAHLPTLTLQDGENPCTIIVGEVLPMVQGHILCKNYHLYRLFWEDCKRKNTSHVQAVEGSPVGMTVVSAA